jgi:hypothetical protein
MTDALPVVLESQINLLNTELSFMKSRLSYLSRGEGTGGEGGGVGGGGDTPHRGISTSSTVSTLTHTLAQARTTHRARVTTWQSRVDTLSRQCSMLTTLTLRLEAAHTLATTESARLLADLDTEQARRAACDAAHRGVVEELEGEREGRRRDREVAEGKVARLAMEVKVEGERRAAAERAVEERDEEIERLREVVRRRYEGVEGVGKREEDGGETRAVDELQLRIRALEARLAGADDYNLSLNAKLVRAAEQLEQAERDLRVERAKLAASEGACDREARLRKRLEEVNNALRADLAKSQSRVVELEGAGRAKELELGRAARDLEEAQAQAARHLDALEREKIKNMEAEADRTQTKLELKHTKEALDRSTRELRRKGKY